MNQFNNFCHPKNWSKFIVYCLQFILKLLERYVTGTKFHKKVKNTKIIKSIQKCLLSEKPINWMRISLPLFQKLTTEMKKWVKISPLIIYPLKTKLPRLIGKDPWWCVRQQNQPFQQKLIEKMYLTHQTVFTLMHA